MITLITSSVVFSQEMFLKSNLDGLSIDVGEVFEPSTYVESEDGKISGVIYKNGRLVKQEFKIDIPDGEGTHVYPDGSKYVGNFIKVS